VNVAVAVGVDVAVAVAVGVGVGVKVAVAVGVGVNVAVAVGVDVAVAVAVGVDVAVGVGVGVPAGPRRRTVACLTMPKVANQLTACTNPVVGFVNWNVPLPEASVVALP
jgi:hypothetical protein